MAGRRPSTLGVLEGSIAATVGGACYGVATYFLAFFGYIPDEWAKAWLGNLFGTVAIGVFAFFSGYFYVKFHDRDGEMSDLEDDLANRKEKLAVARSNLIASQLECKTLKAKLPEEALKTARAEARENNANADYAVAQWLEREGEAPSELLFRRAGWAMERAVADLRPSGLVAAEAYATGPLVLWPANHDAIGLLGDIQVMKAAEMHPLPSLKAALAQMNEYAVEQFNADFVEIANAAAKEAELRVNRGLYHAALPAIERTLALRLRTVGKTSIQTLETQRFKAYVLDLLGRGAEALPIARSVAQTYEDKPAFGPLHPETLRSRHLVAHLLYHLARYDEALRIARFVADELEANPAFGASHAETLAARCFVAQLLARDPTNDDEAMLKEALQIAQSVAEVSGTNLGPSHPQTLTTRFFVAQLLNRFGRFNDALKMAESVAEASETHPALGPSHPETLASRGLVAQLLGNLGHHEKALRLAGEVAAVYEANPSRGPSHPDTLASRYLVANMLRGLGRREDALSIASAVMEAQENNPELGPSHPKTLGSRKLVARLLEDLDRRE